MLRCDQNGLKLEIPIRTKNKNINFENLATIFQDTQTDTGEKWWQYSHQTHFVQVKEAGS